MLMWCKHHNKPFISSNGYEDNDGTYGQHCIGSAMEANQIEHNFTYHPPKDNQIGRYEVLREKIKELALIFQKCCPDSREKSLAMTKLEESVMWANAAIARNE